MVVSRLDPLTNEKEYLEVVELKRLCEAHSLTIKEETRLRERCWKTTLVRYDGSEVNTWLLPVTALEKIKL